MFKKRFIGHLMLSAIIETHFDQGKIRSFSNFTLVPRQTETLIQKKAAPGGAVPVT